VRLIHITVISILKYILYFYINRNKLNKEIERSKIQIRELNNEKEILEDKIDKLEIAEVNDVQYSYLFFFYFFIIKINSEDQN